MSYTFTVRVRQTTAASEWAELVESTVWHFANGGTWRAARGELVFTMGGSGTSGLLRFARGNDEYCVFAMGVHNYKPWTDCVVDCKPGETACNMHPDYYGGGERAKQREKQQRETCKKDCKGREYKIVCSGEGNSCVVEIFIE
ncbi:lectin [Auricularia subglabra TFB-10046 SS5]|uniref:Lectin n=1 Tax=Auricularia subglabra (strain TFB-10046 / SS5) TaxID=717982 RepID=J0CS35_AURST|nr:lectin [Auricularia subglabra TFB-10046 SS5]